MSKNGKHCFDRHVSRMNLPKVRVVESASGKSSGLGSLSSVGRIVSVLLVGRGDFSEGAVGGQTAAIDRCRLAH